MYVSNTRTRHRSTNRAQIARGYLTPFQIVGGSFRGLNDRRKIATQLLMRRQQQNVYHWPH
jgi:hypothetical protein